MSKIPKQVQKIREYKGVANKGSKTISFSQFSLFESCHCRWYRAYVQKEEQYTSSIHTVFGTALHETIQTWLDLLYNKSVKASDEFNYEEFLLTRMKEVYAKDSKLQGHFSTSEELSSFYLDGLAIFEFIKKHRKSYFTTKESFLVGCEIPLIYQVTPEICFKGYIDFLVYDQTLDRWKIYDIKTSTSGWNQEAKRDTTKIAQVLLYKRFFSKLFDIPEDKIDVEYFIVKRKVPEDAEFANMRKRVQEFEPSNGTRSVNQAINRFNNFISTAFTEDGDYNITHYAAAPATETACRFCTFKQTCERFKEN